MELGLIVTLALLLLATNVYWSLVVYKLNDRLMSRNYLEFVQGERLKKPTNVSAKPKVALVDPIAEEHAKRANSLFT